SSWLSSTLASNEPGYHSHGRIQRFEGVKPGTRALFKGAIDWPRRAIVHRVRLANDTEKAKDNICPYRLNTTGVLHVLINAGRQSASGHASRDTKCFQSAEPLVEEPDTVRADRPVARPNPLFSILRRAVGFDLR
ncbi:hypothetical protein ABHI18_012655, partial [Aspergillus niger]